jgi:hypothetical protein
VRASLPWSTQDATEPRPVEARAPSTEHVQVYELDPSAFAFDSQAALGDFLPIRGEHRGIPFEVAALADHPTLDADTIAAWMRGAIEVASQGPGGFPARRLHAIVLPGGSSHEPVPFGAVTRGGTGSVLLFVSEGAALPALARDWVLPHELSHLFVPYVPREHAWFSEGIATYYQEILRARAGVLSASEALLNLADSMLGAAREGTGRPLREESRAMHETFAYRSVYWAGAAYFLIADVALREHSGGERSLDTVLAGLRAAVEAPLESKRASDPDPLDALLARMDELAGEPLFRPLAEACLARSFPDVEPTLAALGVQVEARGSAREKNVEARATDPARSALRDAAPLARLRDRLLGGSSESPAVSR